MALISTVDLGTGHVSTFVTAYHLSVSALNTALVALSGRVSGFTHLGSVMALCGAFRVEGGLVGSSILTLTSLATLSGPLQVTGAGLFSSTLAVTSGVTLGSTVPVTSAVVLSAGLPASSCAAAARSAGC